MDLISREFLKEKLQGHASNGTYAAFYVNSIVDNAPTVEPNECILIVGKRSGKREMLLSALRPHGRWICEDALHCIYYCSECRNNGERIQPFCAWCGADMRGDSNG